MVDFNKIEAVKSKVSIPMYMYNLVVPQMADYYSDYTVDLESRPVMKCCLHDESTPSLRYYEETNTFYCFGCKAGGDVIRLHRLFTEKMVGTRPSFDEAVIFLYDYFIKGNESAASVIPKHKSENEYKSSKQEILCLSKYCATLEGQLISDNSINEESKRKIWLAMDNVDLLISMDMVNATDAMKYVKQVVRESIK